MVECLIGTIVAIRVAVTGPLPIDDVRFRRTRPFQKAVPMPLEIATEQKAKNAWVVSLTGSLNSDTAPGFGERIKPMLAAPRSTLAIDMAGLEYISSAGLREIFHAQKTLKAIGGKLVYMHLKPQIRKVFDIVNVLPAMRIFSSVRELDEYLDIMQKQVTHAVDEGE